MPVAADHARSIRSFIVENFPLGQEIGLSDTQSFRDGGIIDSTKILELKAFLEDTYDIRVSDEELIRENLDSIQKISDYLQSKIGTTDSPRRRSLLPANPLRWASRSLQGRGVAQTAKVAWSFVRDLAFDWRYGTDTIRRVEMSRLKIDSVNRVHAYRYGATKAQPFLELVRQIDIPDGSVFVDIGCGKGKMLLLASECRFRRVVGIDFSLELCAIARNNIELFKKRRRPKVPIEIIVSDAVAYRFAPDQNVFFMFDPFDEYVLVRVLENLRHSVKESPRKVCFLYHSPRHHKVVERSGIFEKCLRFDIRGSEFNSYSN